VIKGLKELTLPKEALIFSADATLMYTNIDTKLGVDSIQNFLSKNSDKLPPCFPKDLLLEILIIVMENNIFTLTNTHWLQLSGTAMGAPVLYLCHALLWTI
jgi:hypothetical protein